jgi:hypothetical protein
VFIQYAPSVATPPASKKPGLFVCVRLKVYDARYSKPFDRRRRTLVCNAW